MPASPRTLAAAAPPTGGGWRSSEGAIAAAVKDLLAGALGIAFGDGRVVANVAAVFITAACWSRQQVSEMAGLIVRVVKPAC